MKRVDSAIILAAGCATRFVPLSYEMHKALITVRGEVLIERQIKQLQEAGINNIYIVVGYRKDDFSYLEKKFKVKLIYNENYLTMNNISSVYAAKEYIKNSYICSSDNYFSKNPFESEVEESYYSAVYANGNTNEWCIDTDEKGYIKNVTISGRDKWYMFGHVFWDEEFSKTFFSLLEVEKDRRDIPSMLWENFYIKHIDSLKMKVRKYPENVIFEFDSLDELRSFDSSYLNNSSSVLLAQLGDLLNCKECEISDFTVLSEENAFGFSYQGDKYICKLRDKRKIDFIKKLQEDNYERKI